MSVLIGVPELQAADAAVILDVRWKLGGPPGHGEYLKGHIPGAVFVDLEGDLSRHGAPTDGRHPLPSLEALQASARRWGVRADQPVVVYDGGGNLAAARAWWLLRWAGVSDVRLLDGALPAWIAAGGELATDDVVPQPSDITLSGGALPVVALGDVAPPPGGTTPRGGALPVLALDEVLAFTESGVLLDARAGERFRGEVEPIDPVAGHIPGATSAPTTENLARDGRFLAPDQLRARFDALGATGERPIAVYCGSGVTAAHEIAALAIAGREAALYAGSWSQWSNHPELPVSTGA